MKMVNALWKRGSFVFAIGILTGCGSDQGSKGDPTNTSAVGTASEQLCAKPGLTSNMSSYVANPGAKVAWTATASCDVSNPQYRFVYRDPSGTWKQAQDWSIQPTYTWDTTGFATGNYSWQAWIRDSTGLEYEYDTFATQPFTLSTAAGACTTATNSVLPASPSVPGTMVTLTGAGTCAGGASPEYRFLMAPPGGSFGQVQAYGVSDSYAWDTTNLADGVYNFQIYVRAQGSPAEYESWTAFSYELNSSTSCTTPTLAISPSNQGVVGSTVTMNGTSAGCGSPEYRFGYSTPAGKWVDAQPYSTNPVFNWNTTGLATGNYYVEMWVRASGHTQAYDTYQSTTYKLTTAAACTNATFSASPASPQVHGTSVTFSATSATCPSPQYRFVYKTPAGAWVNGQSYGAASSFTVDTTSFATGTYSVQVWVRDASSTNDYDTWAGDYYVLN